MLYSPVILLVFDCADCSGQIIKLSIQHYITSSIRVVGLQVLNAFFCSSSDAFFHTRESIILLMHDQHVLFNFVSNSQVWKAELLLSDFVLHKMLTSSEFNDISSLVLGAGTGTIRF